MKGKRCRILYVDDEESLLELGKTFLEDIGGFKVQTASSAKDAIELLENNKYDAVISDYQMPIMDGLQFLKSLRSHDQDLPFIIFTGKGREEVAVEAFMSGADFYLQKGGQPTAQFAELINMVKQAFYRRESERKLRESERTLRSIVDGTDQGMIVVDFNGDVLFFNNSAKTITGVNKGDSLSDLEMFTEGGFKVELCDTQGTMNGMQSDVDSGCLGLQRLRVKRHDGEMIDLEAFQNIIEFDDTKAVLILFRDITSWVRAERCSTVYEARYQSVVHLQREMVARITPEMKVTYANPAFYRILNTKEEDVLGENVFNLLPEEEGFRFIKYVKAISPSNPDCLFRHYLKIADGKRLLLEWDYHGIFDGNDKLIEYQAVGRVAEELTTVND